MKSYTILSFFFILVSTTVFSQEKISHTVAKGETVYSIAKQYQVKSSEILDLNPKAKKVLKLNMVLQIPNKGYKPEENGIANTPVIHEVLAKETLYGISKKYKISMDKIKEANPIIETEGLKLGSKITIPGGNENQVVSTKPSKSEVKPVVKAESKPEVKPVDENPANGEGMTHLVLPKETKYGISKKYKISIQELEKLNPEIVNGLSVGYQLIIRKGSKSEAVPAKPVPTKPIKSQVEEEEEEVTDQNVVKIMESGSSQIQVVEVKESAAPEGENTAVVEVAPLSMENMTKAEFLVAKASENLGARYRSGATGNGGFDCSGLMYVTFKNIDLTLPRSSRDMAINAGIRIDRRQAQKGDLIFFETSGRGVSHVGMVTEVSEDEIKFIHSSTSAGVIVSSTKEAYYAKRFVQVNRVLN